MLDIKLIRENPSVLDEALKKRGAEPLSAKIRELDEVRRARITEIQALQQSRNNFAKEIGAAKRAGQDASELLKKAEENNKRLKELEEKNEKGDELDELLSTLPNIPADDVPLGKSEADNKEIRKWGEPKKFDFVPLEHFDIGEKLGLMSFEDGAKLSGARFVVLKGLLARLERATAQFMLDTHTKEFGYTEVSPPLLVKDSSVYGTGQLPKFGEDLFRTTNGYWLIPTAEVSLTNLVNGEILDEAKLPYRFTAHTPCFRSEAGAAGKDTRGMIRQHQFGKVELVSITTSEQSNDEHERMTKAAETILQRLGLPYRTIVLCTGDMGFSARKTYDIEVWLPGQNQYREISSCSNCGDFQGRRMKSRYRKSGEKETRIVHTLNGSGLAVGRTLIAVLENYQNKDGSVTIPEALRPYMGGVERIG